MINIGIWSSFYITLHYITSFHTPITPTVTNGASTNLLPLSFSMVFLKVLFLVLFSSYSIHLHSVQLYLDHLSIINFMLTTLNFSYHFHLMPFQKKFYSLTNIPYPTFLHGCMPRTFYLSNLLKLNFFSLDFQPNLLKFTIPHLQFLQIQQYT